MNKIIDNSGYSLVEIMLAVALFAFVISIALDIFQSVNQSQRSAIAAQTIQENLRYTLEVMSKEMRQAVRSDDSCKTPLTSFGITSTPINRVYNTGSIAGNNVLFFKKIEKSTGRDICVAYYIDSNRIKIIRVDKNNINNILANDYITPANIKITNFTFAIYDNLLNVQPMNKIQPRVNLQIGAEMASGQLRQPILIQTTISSRIYGD
jgi:prepilin-type N-terminal cleavage/methylation domain-containing protein